MKVVVGMSGGVDSAVTAALLKKEGYEVIGLTMLLIDGFDYSDAEKVCNDLGIEFHLLDLRDKFKEIVINRFINDYKNGITPNPCVICNKYIKFGLMYDELLKYDADYIATGHYARIINKKLYKAKDKNKDQSYFIYNLKKEQLNKILFPLANYTKDEIRKKALEFNLCVAQKSESNDICFIGKQGFSTYINDKIDSAIGDIIDIETGKVIGKHAGVMNYTIGQRKGLNVGGTSDRLFVVKKDVNNNILYVAMGNQNEYLLSYAAVVEDVNLLDEFPNECMAKFRYRQNDNMVQVSKLKDGNILVKYPYGIKSVTPGQACVLYKDDECLGGGIVKRVFTNMDEETQND